MKTILTITLISLFIVIGGVTVLPADEHPDNKPELVDDVNSAKMEAIYNEVRQSSLSLNDVKKVEAELRFIEEKVKVINSKKLLLDSLKSASIVDTDTTILDNPKGKRKGFIKRLLGK